MAPNPDLDLTPSKYLKTITILHLALIAGQVLFAIVALVQTKKLIINVRYTRDPLLFVVPIFAAGGFVVSNILFKRKLGGIDKTAPLKTKLLGYQSAFIIRLAALEAPSLLGIVAFLITGQLLFLIISAAVIVYFILLKPTKQNIEEALELNYPEKENFSQGNKVL